MEGAQPLPGQIGPQDVGDFRFVLGDEDQGFGRRHRGILRARPDCAGHDASPARPTADTPVLRRYFSIISPHFHHEAPISLPYTDAVITMPPLPAGNAMPAP
ncbi:hypothetical protein AZSI13_07900 [Azospira sp. I13]|nr:hypothetical protein AZSI13_07900 [Azospira sp. I13]